MNEKFKIIRDNFTEYFYCVHQDEHDSEDEFSIVSYALSEVEAYQIALQKVGEAFENYKGAVEDFCNAISFSPRSIDLSEKFYIKSESIPSTYIDENAPEDESFDAFSYDRTNDIYIPFCR